MKVLYNVTIIIDHSMHDEWLIWMKETHIADVMATGYFLEYKLLRIIDQEPNPDGVTYAIQYLSPDMQSYLSYQSHEAPRLQALSNAKFHGMFAAFRTCMYVID